MLTMKHIMHPKQGESVEFVREIGCYAVKRQGNYFQFLAYDRRDTDTPDVWAGWVEDEGNVAMVMGTIYVMNEAGSTVANFRYHLPESDVEPVFAPEPPASANRECAAAA